MAVQAQQQFLENPSLHLLCNTTTATNNSLGWVDSRGGIPVDFYRSIQQLERRQEQQQQMMAMVCSPLMNQYMEKEKQEIDQFLCLHSQRLRVALHQQRKQHLLSLMKRLESKASNLLGRKEEELARVRKKTMELEECLRKAESDNQTWQRIANENEAMAVTLSNTLEQVRDNACLSSTIAPAAVVVEDAASCCDSLRGPSDPKCGSSVGEQGDQSVGIGRCKGCWSMDSCMLFLPCMHLCACKFCDGLIDSCPVCRSVKEGSIEVFLA